MALIAFEDAVTRSLAGLGRLAAERVGLAAAAGRVLAEDLCADAPMPPFSHSAMDGYAVQVSWFDGDGPWTFDVRGQSRAGEAGPALAQRQACRIFTGAPLPDGADAIIIQEQVTRTGDRITIGDAPQQGQHIRARGADLAIGAAAIEAGTRLGPGQLGLVAALDHAHVMVARRPIVTIVSTGDELRPPGARPPADTHSDSSIAESKSFVIAAAAERVGATARVMPLLEDDAPKTREALRHALAATDLLVTIGGASVGDHDLVRPALQAIGVEIDFWGVAMKPGKPVAMGRAQGARVLCLPGNPASAAVTFMLLGIPMLRAMQGDVHPRPQPIPLRIIGSHQRRPGRQEYLRARLEQHDGELCAVISASQSSGAVTSLARADALVVVAADKPTVHHGERIPVIQLRDIWGS